MKILPNLLRVAPFRSPFAQLLILGFFLSVTNPTLAQKSTVKRKAAFQGVCGTVVFKAGNRMPSPKAPHEVLLVLDGSTGQNAFMQATEFTKATDVSALAITKLDGTAKGGVVIGISDQFRIPVKYIGVGEKIEDLQTFNKMEFVDSFFKKV